MNKEWSALNKTMQSQIKKKGTFEEGIGTLLTLRDELMNEVLSWREKYKREDFDAMPFINADGYHCKNIAYSIWHVFRIEDIVAHDLIAGDDEVLFTGDYQKRIKFRLSRLEMNCIKRRLRSSLGSWISMSYMLMLRKLRRVPRVFFQECLSRRLRSVCLMRAVRSSNRSVS